jgi:hypothetical protein
MPARKIAAAFVAQFLRLRTAADREAHGAGLELREFELAVIDDQPQPEYVPVERDRTWVVSNRQIDVADDRGCERFPSWSLLEFT